MGSVGVTGTTASNRLAAEADLVLAVGTRLQDFTTGSWALFKEPDLRIVGLNAQTFDAGKHRALPLVADAKVGLEALDQALGEWRTIASWTETAIAAKNAWLPQARAVTDPTNAELPSDAQVIGAVHRARGSEAILVCAAGGLPGELHKLWPAGKPGSYHMEYGYSTMGYEIAGGLGVKLARPDDDVVVMLGDGSYMMMNSEIASSVMLGAKLTIVVLDNRGYGCINRLQMATGGANFNNLLKDARHEVLPEIDFVAHAASMGAVARKAGSIAELEAALKEAEADTRTSVIVIDTDPLATTEAGGAWWDVAVPEVSARAEVNAARKEYEDAVKGRRL
jgi:3D-(3,5/4)-trihydroxycyclohexane-1,2-dione acylhydrolase (decyclizing)